jgi:3-phenylpropionate/cinnamic acid dioxygenase small subunit
MSLTMVDAQMRAQVDHLQIEYVHALDDGRFEDWPALFTETGRYRVTTAENHAAGLPLCLMQADSPAMMRDRVAALRHANIYEAQTYRHVVSSTRFTALDDGVAQTVSHFHVARIMHDGALTLFATGRYVDRIALGDSPRFIERLVLLDSRRIDTLLAIPL